MIVYELYISTINKKNTKNTIPGPRNNLNNKSSISICATSISLIFIK